MIGKASKVIGYYFNKINNLANKMRLTDIINILAICVILSNCAPARIIKDDNAVGVKTSKVKITREDSWLFLLVPAIFGYDEKDKISLRNGKDSELNVPVGKREFFVRSDQADKPFKSNIEVRESETLCLTIKPEPKPVIKFIIPFFYYFSHAFKIEESTVCE